MKSDKLRVSSLETKFENMHYGAIFSTETVPWSILFIRPDNMEYSVDVLYGFKFSSIKNLAEFKDFFNIPKATMFTKDFSPYHVLSELDQNFKFKTAPNFYERSAECVNRKIEDADRVYYYKTVNHEQNVDGKTFTPENRRKVKELLPETYERIKNSNISIGFTDWEHAKFRNPDLEKKEIDHRLSKHNL